MSSRITVKKNLIIFHDPLSDWSPIRKRLVEEYGQSIVLTYAMRERLGFSSRFHTEWISGQGGDPNQARKYPEEQIHLDFYNKAAQTWFQLKYLNQFDSA
jgi:hypothetical protein